MDPKRVEIVKRAIFVFYAAIVVTVFLRMAKYCNVAHTVIGTRLVTPR